LHADAVVPPLLQFATRELKSLLSACESVEFRSTVGVMNAESIVVQERKRLPSDSRTDANQGLWTLHPSDLETTLRLSIYAPAHVVVS
jgi:hypothetical protein